MDTNFTLQQAIEKCHDVANIQHTFNKEEQRKCSAEYQQLAMWLSELNCYKDKTYISAEWLVKNEFQKREYDYLFCNDVVEISAQCTDTEAGTWHVYVNWLDRYSPQSLDIYTLGEFRMFLAICGLDNLVKEFKS